MFLLNILKAVLAYDLVKIRFIKEKEVIHNGNTNDKSRGIQLIGPGYLQKVLKGVNWLLSPILLTRWNSLKYWARTLILPSIYMSEHTTKPTIRPVWPMKTQISLYIHPVWQGFSFIPLRLVWRHVRSAKTLSRLRGCAGWSESLLVARFILGFVVHWLIRALILARICTGLKVAEVRIFFNYKTDASDFKCAGVRCLSLLTII